MHGRRQRLLLAEVTSHGVHHLAPDTAGIQKFFEIHRIHIFDAQTAQRYRLRVLQRYAEQRTAGYVCKPLFLHQKLDKRQQVVVGLNFVDEYQSRCLVFHFVAGYDAECHIEIFGCARIFKDTIAQTVFFHVHFNIVWEHFLADLAHDVRLADLARAGNEQHAVRIGSKVFFDALGNLAVQHIILQLFNLAQRYGFFLETITRLGCFFTKKCIFHIFCQQKKCIFYTFCLLKRCIFL